jgi:hypothetical protein
LITLHLRHADADTEKDGDLFEGMVAERALKLRDNEAPEPSKRAVWLRRIRFIHWAGFHLRRSLGTLPGND